MKKTERIKVDRERFYRGFNLLIQSEFEVKRVGVDFNYSRIKDGYQNKFTSEVPLKIATVHVGSFPDGTHQVKVEGIEENVGLNRKGTSTYAYLTVYRYWTG